MPLPLPTIPTVPTVEITTATVATPTEAPTQPVSIWKNPATQYDLAKWLIPMIIAFTLAVFGYLVKQDAQARDVEAIKTQIATYPAIKEQRIQQITQLNDTVVHLAEAVTNLDKKVDKNDAETKANLRDIQTDIKTLLQRPVH